MVGDRRRAAERPVTVRPAVEADAVPLSHLDLTYPAGRYLALTRTGTPPQHFFTLVWRQRDAPNRLYAEYSQDRLRGAMQKVDLFLTAVVDGRPIGLLMVMLPTWTDAAEITDLAVDFPARRSGAGRALVNAAAKWARANGNRSLWVEPRTDNADAIEFYVRMGFRVSGFNDRLYSNADDRPGATTIFMHLPLR